MSLVAGERKKLQLDALSESPVGRRLRLPRRRSKALPAREQLVCLRPVAARALVLGQCLFSRGNSTVFAETTHSTALTTTGTMLPVRRPIVWAFG